MRAKRAMFTFWMDKSELKRPKIVHYGEFLKICSLRSNSVTRQVSFNRTKIGGKCQNSILQMRYFEWFSNNVYEFAFVYHLRLSAQREKVASHQSSPKARTRGSRNASEDRKRFCRRQIITRECWGILDKNRQKCIWHPWYLPFEYARDFFTLFYC